MNFEQWYQQFYVKNPSINKEDKIILKAGWDGLKLQILSIIQENEDYGTVNKDIVKSIKNYLK